MPQANPLAVLVILAILASIVAAWLSVLLRFAFQLPILPPRTPRVVPWGAKSVLAAILLWFAMQNVAAAVYYVAARRPKGEVAAAPAGKSSLSPLEMMGLSAAGNMATVIAIPLLLAATAGARPRDFGLEGPGVGRQVLRGIVAYPLLAPCVFGLMLVAVSIWGKTNHPLEDAMVKDRSPETVAVLAFAGVVMAPLAEELIFRGVLLGWLTRLALGVRSRPGPTIDPDWMGAEAQDVPPSGEIVEGSFLSPIAVETVDADVENPYRAPVASIAPVEATIEPTEEVEAGRPIRLLLANVAVSALFATLHGAQWPAPVPIFVLSMGLGLLYQRTGSLIGPIALHMTFNGVSTLLMFLTAGTPAPADPRTPNPIPGPAIYRAVLGEDLQGNGAAR